MAIKRQPVKVLRFWYRISLMPEVQALSHPAFRWLYGVVMAWTGHNNGVIVRGLEYHQYRCHGRAHDSREERAHAYKRIGSGQRGICWPEMMSRASHNPAD